MKTLFTAVAIVAALTFPAFAEAENPSDNSSATGSFKLSEQQDRSAGARAYGQYRIVGSSNAVASYARSGGGSVTSKGSSTKELDMGIK